MRITHRPAIESCQRASLYGLVARAVGVAFVSVSLAMASAASTFAADTVAKIRERIDELNADAINRRNSKNYEELERLRKKRWGLARELQAAAPGASVWAKAYKALIDVDGISKENDRHVPGLIDQMRYREAYEHLMETWRDISSEPGVIPSEVATRLFEVTQQALSNTPLVFKDEPGGGSDAFASRQELTEILAAASERDPCGVLAAVMNSFIDKPTTSEVFLRMEVRPSMVKRQEVLSALAHPAMLVTGGAQSAVAAGNQNVVALNSSAGEKRTERADVPIQSWHAPVEWCRIKSLSAVLEDLDFCRYLAPDEINGKYITPGEIIGVIDAAGNPAELLYGRLLIYRTTDSLGRNRTAVSYVNEAGRWVRKYIDVLMVESRATRQSTASATTLSKVLDMVPAVATVELGDIVVAIKELPPGKTSAFLQQSSEVYCSLDVFKMIDTSYSLTDNSPTFLNVLEDTPQSQFESQIFTTPAIRERIDAFKAEADPTKHPLRELLLTHRHSPLVVVSLNDGMPAEPAWVKDGDAVYLEMINGGRLKYVVNGKKAEKALEVDFGNGVTSVFPLNTHAMPLGVLMQSRAADVLLRMLADAGYKPMAAESELHAFMASPLYFPAKALERLGKRATAKKQKLTQVVEDALRELGWDTAQDKNPRDSLLQTRQRFGIRFLKEPRGSYVVHPDVRKLYSEEKKKSKEVREKELQESPPFLVVRPSGEPVPFHQIYTFADYKQLWGNRYEEHTKKLIALHPCYAVSWNARDQLKSVIVDPAHRVPSFLRVDDTAGIAQSKNAFNAFKQLLVESRQGASITLERCGLLENPVDVARHSLLHNKLAEAYRNCLIGEALIFRLLAEERILRDSAIEAGVEALVTEGKLGRALDERFSAAKNRFYEVQATRMLAQQEYRANKMLLAATDLTEARRFAKSGRLHAASVRYNDLLDATTPAVFKTTLLQGVATNEAAQAFLQSLRGFIDREYEIGVIEAELGGTLAAAGKGDAAFFLWNELAAQHRYLIIPLMKACERYMTAYGLRLSDEVASALAEYSGLVELCDEQLRKLDHPLDYRAAACLPRKDDDGVGAAVADFAALLERQESEPPPDRVMAMFRKWTSSDISFTVWGRTKAVAARSGNWRPLLSASFTGIPLASFAPKRYDPESGFIGDLRELFTAERLTACAQWAETGGERECSDRERMIYCVLLSWYWADRGSLVEFRKGLREASAAAFAAADGEADAATSLTDQRNAISCIAASFVGIKLPVGVSLLRSGALSTIPPLLLLLEREWSARGLDPLAISRDVFHLNAAIRQQGLENPVRAGDHRMKRWFFPDYSYRVGCVPDSWWEIAGEGPVPIEQMVDDRFKGFDFRQYDKEVIEMRFR